MKNMTKTDIYKVQRAIREVFVRSKHYKDVVTNNVSDEVGVRGGKKWKCESCGKSFIKKEMNLHHSPAILEGDVRYDEIGFNEFVRRVWADEEYLWYLCKKCHKEQHSNEEV